jgi:hypothetical protein
MAFFVVTYDLRKKDEFNYQELWDEFDRLDAVKHQESDYFLAAANKADEIRDHFKAFIRRRSINGRGIRKEAQVHESSKGDQCLDRQALALIIRGHSIRCPTAAAAVTSSIDSL